MEVDVLGFPTVDNKEPPVSFHDWKERCVPSEWGVVFHFFPTSLTPTPVLGFWLQMVPMVPMAFFFPKQMGTWLPVPDSQDFHKPAALPLDPSTHPVPWTRSHHLPRIFFPSGLPGRPLR